MLTPGFGRYFYEGANVAEADEEERARVAAISELMLDCFECIWDIRATYSAIDRGSWGRYVLDMLDSSPAMKDMFEQRRDQDWYPALEDLQRANELGVNDARTVRILRWGRRLWGTTAPPRS